MKGSIKERLAQMIMHLTLLLFSLSALIPFVLTFIVSISDESSVMKKGYSFFPDAFSLNAYKVIFTDDIVFRAYGVTLTVTILGTILSVIICSLAAYAMSIKKVKYRNNIALYFYIPMVFNAGLVPWYLVVTKLLMLKNSIAALILPMLISPFNLFLLRNYFKSIPSSLMESAEIDGARPLTTLFKIILPLSTPILATVSLFVALAYWNDWVMALWLIDKEELFPLQYMLYRIQSLIIFLKTNTGQSLASAGELPMQTVQMATLFVTIGPIIILYPFVQKYFVKGIMVGAIKG